MRVPSSWPLKVRFTMCFSTRVTSSRDSGCFLWEMLRQEGLRTEQQLVQARNTDYLVVQNLTSPLPSK
jgi:hypothetical protein